MSGKKENIVQLSAHGILHKGILDLFFTVVMVSFSGSTQHSCLISPGTEGRCFQGDWLKREVWSVGGNVPSAVEFIICAFDPSEFRSTHVTKKGDG